MLHRVQISLRDRQYAERLRQYLQADPSFEDCAIVCEEPAELGGESENGVRVIDVAYLPELPKPLGNPAKMVLMSSGTVDLEQVWESGIPSILQDSESLEYVKLAILAAMLRPGKPARPGGRRRSA